MTWYPQSFADNVPMTNMRMRPDPTTGYPGRTYRFYTGPSLYIFGDGLSYSQFSHHLVRAPKLVSVPLADGHGCLTQKCMSVDTDESSCQGLAFDVHLRVRNNGAMHGAHTVFLFFSPPFVHDAPRKQLIGFEKVFLVARTEQVVMFTVDVCKDMSVVDGLGNKKLPLGSHTLHVGSLKHSLNVRV